MTTEFITDMVFWYILFLIILTTVLYYFTGSFYVPIFIGGLVMVLGVRRGVLPPWLSVLVYMTLIGTLAVGIIRFIMGGKYGY